MNSLDAIRNYIPLTAEIGTAGQPRRDQFELITAGGYQSVINIAMPEHSDSIADEGSLVTGLGMNYFHLPVPYDSPGTDHLRQFCELLIVQRGRRLFVHCIMNYRVSAFMYHYLTRVMEFSEQQARSPIFESWQMEPQWQAFMQLDASALDLSQD